MIRCTAASGLTKLLNDTTESVSNNHHIAGSSCTGEGEGYNTLLSTLAKLNQPPSLENIAHMTFDLKLEQYSH